MAKYVTGGFRRGMPRIILAIVWFLLVKRVFSQSPSFELKPFQWEAPPKGSTSVDPGPAMDAPKGRMARLRARLSGVAPQPNLRAARLISRVASEQALFTTAELAAPEIPKVEPPQQLDIVTAPKAQLQGQKAQPSPFLKTIQPFSLDALVPPAPSSTTPGPPPIIRAGPSLIQAVTPSSASKFAWTPFSVQIQGNSVALPTQPPRAPSTSNLKACPRSSFGPCKCSEPDPFEASQLPVLDCSKIFSPTQLMTLRGTGRGVHFSRIVLRNTGITTLPTGAFGFHKADEYWITDNPVLTTVEQNAFGVQADPRKLILQNNQIEKFPFEDLKRFRNLEYFVANGNALREIPDGAFSIPGGKLVDILLHDNQIGKLGPRLFGYQNNLNAITLHNNALDEIKADALYFTGSPQTLSLSGNQITKVDKDAFGGAIPRIVDISNNKLEDFPRESWALALYAIARMNEEDPRNPARLIVAGNPMRCECDVLWLYQSKEILEPTVDGFFCSGAEIPMNLFDLPRWHFFPNCL